jgi:hypothetical protein
MILDALGVVIAAMYEIKRLPIKLLNKNGRLHMTAIRQFAHLYV